MFTSNNINYSTSGVLDMRWQIANETLGASLSPQSQEKITKVIEN